MPATKPKISQSLSEEKAKAERKRGREKTKRRKVGDVEQQNSQREWLATSERHADKLRSLGSNPLSAILALRAYLCAYPETAEGKKYSDDVRRFVIAAIDFFSSSFWAISLGVNAQSIFGPAKWERRGVYDHITKGAAIFFMLQAKEQGLPLKKTGGEPGKGTLRARKKLLAYAKDQGLPSLQPTPRTMIDWLEKYLKTAKVVATVKAEA